MVNLVYYLDVFRCLVEKFSVPNWARQARGNSGKETKTPLGDLMEKNKPWEKPGSVGVPVLLWPINKQRMIIIIILAALQLGGHNRSEYSRDRGQHAGDGFIEDDVD